LRLIDIDKLTIKNAAKELGLNYSTAKFIYKQHKTLEPSQFDSKGKKIRRRRQVKSKQGAAEGIKEEEKK
jgi:hypothetical protein